MTALSTARMVLEWVADPRGTPPLGSLMDTESLYSPTSDDWALAGDVARLAIAKWNWQDASSSINHGLFVMAAVVGCRNMEVAPRFLLQATPPVASETDLVARHSILVPTLSFLREDVAVDMRKHSPLTAVLDRPPPGDEDAACNRLREWIAITSRRGSMASALAAPTECSLVRKWRSKLLNVLRQGSDDERTFVLEVYEAAFVFFREQTLEQIQFANDVLHNDESESKKIEQANSIAQWWQPLWGIKQSHRDLIRARPYLPYEYLDGLALFRLNQRLTGGTV